MIRELSSAEVATPGFRRLLHEAATLDDAVLDAILATEFPLLEVIGDGDPIVAFAAFAHRCSATVVEYVAVTPEARGGGTGRALIEAIRGRYPKASLVAETDDDAVDFYERLGFAVEAAEPDPRWPDRQRYRCRLAPLGGEQGSTAC